MKRANIDSINHAMVGQEIMHREGGNAAANESRQVIKVTWNKVDSYISVSQICYIESINKTCVIYTVSGKCFNTSQPLYNILEDLKEFCFIQVHKSFVVSMACVISSTAKKIKVIGVKEELPVGRKYNKALTEHLITYTKLYLPRAAITTQGIVKSNDV